MLDLARRIFQSVGRSTQAYCSDEAPSDAIFVDFLQRYQFDGNAYASYYADLATLDEKSALQHFVQYGFAEGRNAPLGVSMASIQALRQTQWHCGWKIEMARRAAGAALWTVEPGGTDLQRFTDILSPSPDYIPAIMIGDSHAAFLTQTKSMLLSGVLPVPMICSGGSARGLQNAKSRAQYGAYILNRLNFLNSTNLNPPVIFKFGQVDIEFLFDLKRVREKEFKYSSERMKNFIVQTVDCYCNFLALCRSSFSGRLIIMSIFPPTLGDDTLRAGYVNAHIAFLNQEDEAEQLRNSLAALDHPDLAERTEAARYWNQQLASRCNQLALPYLEEFDALLGEDGVIHPELADPTDHHLLLQSPHAQSRIAAVGARLRQLASAAACYVSLMLDGDEAPLLQSALGSNPTTLLLWT